MWKGLLLHIKAVNMNQGLYWGGVSAVIQVSCEEQKGGALVNGLPVPEDEDRVSGWGCNNYTKI